MKKYIQKFNIDLLKMNLITQIFEKRSEIYFEIVFTQIKYL